MKPSYDVVIVGAGMVGLVMACALGNSKLKVGLLDTREPITEWNSEQYDLRVSAVTVASQQVLQKLNVWQAIQAQRISPFRKMHVWDAQGKGIIDFNNIDIGEPNLGYIIENRVIQKSLYEQAKQYSNINFIFNKKLKNLTQEDKNIVLELDDDEVILAQLVVGADGAESQVRKLSNCEINEREYGHTALVATVYTEISHQQTAWQLFLPTGPLAFLPLDNPHYCSIVWSTSPEHAQQLQKLDKAEFCQQLTTAFENKLGVIQDVSERIIFPLKMRHVKNYVKSNIALIGDAAHTIHPLAGQGANLGIADAMCLTNVILTAKKNERSFSALHTLRKYERARKGDNTAMLAAMDGFKGLFASENSLLQSIRSFGLNITNRLTFLKKCFMRYV